MQYSSFCFLPTGEVLVKSLSDVRLFAHRLQSLNNSTFPGILASKVVPVEEPLRRDLVLLETRSSRQLAGDSSQDTCEGPRQFQKQISEFREK